MSNKKFIQHYNNISAKYYYIPFSKENLNFAVH